MSTTSNIVAGIENKKTTSRAFKAALADFHVKNRFVRDHDGTEENVRHVANKLIEEYMRARFDVKRYDVSQEYSHSTDGIIKISPVMHPGLFDGNTENNRSLSGFSILIEAKKSLLLSAITDKKTGGRPARAKVLAQVVAYLHNIKESGSGHDVPTVAVVVDDDEIFAVPTKMLLPHLDVVHDWKTAPSSAGEKGSALYEAVYNDNNLALIHVEDHSLPTFDANHFLEKVVALGSDSNNLVKLPINKLTLSKAFEEFNHSVFGGETTKKDTKTKVSIFVKALLEPTSIYFSNENRNEIFYFYTDHKGEEKRMKFPENATQSFSADAFEMFFTKWDRSYFTVQDRKDITEIADSLFEDFDRRFTGDFWTPAVWVNEAHRVIEKQLGNDWREKYIVWDPACGSKNLTRDYTFGELYCSTLHQDELNIATQYNPEASSFQYDFLNDDMDLHAMSEGLFAGKNVAEMSEEEKFAWLTNQKGKWKLPDGLIEALVLNKPIVFLGNPPYGSNGNISNGEAAQTRKTGVAQNGVAEHMRTSGVKFGHAVQELYTQFIYRVQKLAETFGYTQDFFFFFFFFNKGFLTSPNFKVFADKLKNEFTYREGFMLNAGEFSGTSSAWGIIFSGWEIGGGKQDSLNFKVLRSSHQDRDIVEDFTTWENIAIEAQNTISTLCVNPNKTFSDGYPTTKNGFEITNGQKYGTMTASAFGYFHNHGNNIQYSDKYVGMYSMCFNGGHGVTVDQSNFTQSSIVFAVRKAWLDIIADQKLLWVRDKDIFPAPTQEFQDSPEWKNFEADCVVYSLFAKGSNQTGLRRYEYGTEKDGSPKLWRVKNEFFWLSKDQIVALADKHRNQYVQADVMSDQDRYVYKWLQEHNSDLSESATELLNIATEILVKSFQYRAGHYYDHPKFDLNAWDAGWEQVRRMCFGNDALPAAKSDPELQELYSRFLKVRRTLGDSIAERYSADTGF